MRTTDLQIGIILGLGAVLVCTRLLTTFLYWLTPNDPPTLVVVSLLLLTVARVASYLPARRTARVDPMAALRHE